MGWAGATQICRHLQTSAAVQVHHMTVLGLIQQAWTCSKQGDHVQPHLAQGLWHMLVDSF